MSVTFVQTTACFARLCTARKKLEAITFVMTTKVEIKNSNEYEIVRKIELIDMHLVCSETTVGSLFGYILPLTR